jgi:hypothetical protein
MEAGDCTLGICHSLSASAKGSYRRGSETGGADRGAIARGGGDGDAEVEVESPSSRLTSSS